MPRAGGRCAGRGSGSRGAWSRVPWARRRERRRPGGVGSRAPAGPSPGSRGLEASGASDLQDGTAGPWITLESLWTPAPLAQTSAPPRTVSSEARGYLGDGKEL